MYTTDRRRSTLNLRRLSENSLLTDEIPKEESISDVAPKSSSRAGFYLTIKIFVAFITVSAFAFLSIGFGETPYTSRHLARTIFTGGGLLPYVFSPQSKVAMQAAADTMRGEINLGRGNYAEAERALAKALVAYEALDAVNTTCGHMCLSGLAKSASEQKKDPETLKHLTSALQAAEHVYGKEHEVVAGVMRELAYHHTWLKDYATAETLYKKALALDKKGLGPVHFDIAYDMSCIGQMELLQNNYSEAIKQLSESLVMYKQVRGEYHPSFFWVEESLAKAYYESKSYAQAARQFESVLARADRVHGSPGKDYLRQLAWLGWSYHYDSNEERAKIRAKKLAHMLDEKNDSEALTMADTIASAGDLLTTIGEHELAVSQYERLIKLQEASLKYDDPQIRKTLLYAADCYDKLGQPEKADRYRSAYAAESNDQYKRIMQR